MSKKLNVTQLANEFASQSVFFKKNTTENTPVKVHQKVEQSLKDGRTVVRSNGRSYIRRTLLQNLAAKKDIVLNSMKIKLKS